MSTHAFCLIHHGWVRVRDHEYEYFVAWKLDGEYEYEYGKNSDGEYEYEYEYGENSDGEYEYKSVLVLILVLVPNLALWYLGCPVFRFF